MGSGRSVTGRAYSCRPTAMFTPHDKHHSCTHWGATLATGLLAGVAAALFFRSDRGERLLTDAERAARLAKKRVSRGLTRAQRVTREAYEDAVEEIVERYQETKDLADEQVDQLRRTLLARWEDVRTRLDPDEGGKDE